MAERTVLKEKQLYLVSNENGDISSHNSEGHGLYWRDTRFLSLYELTIEGTHPVLLSAAGEHSFMNNFQFSNPALVTQDGVAVPARALSIRRNRFIHEGLHERIGFFNYAPHALNVCVCISLGSDFRDMFDVRGYTSRAVHGTIHPPTIENDTVQLRYEGLDGIPRTTCVIFQPTPDRVELVNLDVANQIQARVMPGLSGHGDPRTEFAVTPPTAEAHFALSLPPKTPRSITVHVVPGSPSVDTGLESRDLSLDQKFVLIRDSYREWEAESTRIETDHDILNRILTQASRDLRLLSEQMPSGYVPSAGIPWFSVPFGRDSLITSLQTLMLQPEIAYGSLRFLAAHQGQQHDDWRDEQPGKILHEVRRGEIARLGDVPHTPYYGSIDSTPLFLVALGDLLEWTDDVEFVQEMRPHAEAALAWLDQCGDLDGDGFVEYASRSPSGIRNQGWKDSRDAIAYPDGQLVEPPIALAEVQGYVYAARLRMAKLYRRLGVPKLAEEQERRAADLQRRFKRDFYVPRGACYAIALGPDKRPVSVVSSNPGHCLWSGLLDGEEGQAQARRLLRDDMDSGWGIRTLSSQEPLFNPMSYHNGSVWPHDNALIAAGFKRLGLDVEAARLIGEVFEAAMRFPGYRLPELYCGFARDRRYFSMPAEYPVSCSPQAWASGAVFSMIQTLLGLRVQACCRRLLLRPRLPEWLRRVNVRRLHVVDRRVDFDVLIEHNRARVEIADSAGLEVVVEPAAGHALAQ